MDSGSWRVEMIGCPASWDACVAICQSEEAARKAASDHWTHLTSAEREQVDNIIIFHGDDEIVWPSSAQEIRECCPSEHVEGVPLFECPGGWFVDDVPEFDNGDVSVQDVLMAYADAIEMVSNFRPDLPTEVTTTAEVTARGNSLGLSITRQLRQIGADRGDLVEITLRKV